MLAPNDSPLSVRDAIAACRLYLAWAITVYVLLLARASADGLIGSSRSRDVSFGASALQLAGEVAIRRTAEQRIRPWQGGYIAVLTQHLGRTDRTAFLRKRETRLAMLVL